MTCSKLDVNRSLGEREFGGYLEGRELESRESCRINECLLHTVSLGVINGRPLIE